MNTEKYIVRLTDEERLELETIVKKLKGTSQKVKCAIVLFKPEYCREILRRCEFVYTPVHGSWLNIVENELSVLTKQCLRLPPEINHPTLCFGGHGVTALPCLVIFWRKPKCANE